MRKKTLSLIALILASFVFQGENCIVSDRDVEVVIGLAIDQPQVWMTRGFDDPQEPNVDTQQVDIGGPVKDAIADGTVDVSALTAVMFNGGGYDVLLSTGNDQPRNGTISIDGVPLLVYNVQTNAAGTSARTGDGTGRLSLNGAGVGYLNGLLNSFLMDLKNGLDPSLMVTYTATWNQGPVEGVDPEQDFFDWTTSVNLQIIGTVSIEVPNPGA